MLRKKRSRYASSEKLFAAASKILPGGVDSPVRAFKAVGATPLFIERGRGAYIEDADGHTYIDYVMSWGPLIHGHAPKALVKALAAAAARGTSFGAPTRARNPAGTAGRGADAVDGTGTVRQFRDRGDDERGASGAGVHQAGQDRQVRGLLPRPRRSVPGPGRIGRDDARRADQSWCAGRRRRATRWSRATTTSTRSSGSSISTTGRSPR